MKTSKMMWVSSQDPSVMVDTSFEALQLAEMNPTEPKYFEWVQVLVIVDRA